LIEVAEAVISCLKGEAFNLFPDFPTGGLADVSEYQEGNGKLLVRAKLDSSEKSLLAPQRKTSSTQ